MSRKKCSLCGGTLVDNRCTLCGLDNSVYDREAARLKNAAMQQKYSSSVEAVSRSASPPRKQESVDPSAPLEKTFRQSSTDFHVGKPSAGTLSHRTPKNRNNKKTVWIIWIVIIIIILSAILPGLINTGSSVLNNVFVSDDSGSSSWNDTYSDSGSDDGYTYDPYGYVTREIPAEGDSYEVVLGNGIYKTGVHIPEGIYRAELTEGSGAMQIRDDENSIFYSVYFGTDEEYDEVTENNDIRLYNGSELEVDSSVILRFTTDNAQPLIQEPSPNPLTETVTLKEGTYTAGNGDLPEGIFDVSAIDISGAGTGYAAITLVYPDGTTSYLWTDNQSFTAAADDYTDSGVKNVVIPSGTEVSIEYGDTVFTPSKGYYDVDFSRYNGY